ncbi:hypothetical protein FJ651_13345 [Paucihalobacter ruber]|uniref:Lysylphosphatidylglycerol synthase-like protein n=1 Tax=Paucihalobacter ruber TaxID=2567861 RepID=A0A506PE33_9FLAO|nr:hypothetical protein [Paucihalobacter ruber]TPV31804.1 hypothetical protein FJ651_13345 [Paucihalobacter ruber]
MILSIFNWFLEIKKWQLLVTKVSDLSFRLALQQSLTALTVSLITPNRIGDYGAKALFYPNHLRGKIMLLNLVGNFWQMATTVIFGLFGILLLIIQFNYQPFKYEPWHFLIPIGFFALIMFASRLKNYRIQGVSISEIIKFIQNYSLKGHTKIATLSITRYLVFSFQLYFLLNLCGADLSYLNAMAGISAMYLLASVVPVFQLFDAAVKGGIAMVIFGLFNVPAIVVLSAVTCMWFLNVVIPAMFGSVYLFNLKTARAF